MKTKSFFTFVLLAVAAVCQGQESAQTPLILPGRGIDPAEREAAIRVKREELAGQMQIESFNPLNVPAAPIAEEVTGAIQQLARDLENDPVRIYNYVHDHIRHVMYFGSKKGAKLTLLEKSGNEFDQCALLMALLRAAGHTNAGYQFGWMRMPYESADHKDLKHWLQLSLSNSNWNTTSNYLDNLVRVYRGYPATAAIWGSNTFAFQRIWVALTNGSTVYYLDPAFKVHEPIPGINLQTATGLSSNSLMSIAGGTDAGYYVTNLNEVAIRSTLTAYTTNLLNYIQTNCPNASVAEVLSGWRIVPSTNITLSQTLPFLTHEWSGQMPVLNWANQPTNLMSRLTVAFGFTNFTCFMPQLKGQRLNLAVDFFSYVYLSLEGAFVAADYAYTGDVAIRVNHPIGYWDTNNNDFVDTTAYDQSSTNSYWASDGNPPYFNIYNIAYAFEPDWGWLQERQNLLDYYRQTSPDDNFWVYAETMNVMSLQYLLQTSWAEQMLAAQTGVLPQLHHFVGRLAQEAAHGYYFDFFMAKGGDISGAGFDAANTNRLNNFQGLAAYFASALEHGIIEQLQDSNYVAASTIKLLQLANTNGIAVYLATSTNWQTGANVRSKLTGYTTAEKGHFDTLITAGDILLLPQHGIISLGSGTWSGNGYVVVGPLGAGMMINGLYGGAVSDPYGTVNARYVSSSAHAQPWRKVSGVNATGGDPVDMATAAFQINATDLSLGQLEPRGITFGRQYNSQQRYVNPAGMAPGWLHNYYANAQSISAPQAGLGGTTPAQAAPMIAATCAAIGIYNDVQHNPKNWMVSALIAKWGVDQLNKKGVSALLGKNTLQFVLQPDGTFTPPANCTWSLAKPSAYVLQERHGNTFKFDALGRLTNTVDQYAQPLNVSYVSASSYLPQTVTDWKGRSITFNYTANRLTSVSDSTGRSVSYGYTSNDLTSVTDPENKTSTFIYDANHQIVAVKDALNQLVTTNIYDPYAFGRVNIQYAQGDTNKAWRIYWSGWETVVQDPTGSKQRFLYDDDNRLVGFKDALGNLSQTFFDGQDHLVATVSPLNETNQFAFDKNHNLLYSVDPLGFTNRFVYDSQDNLTQQIDARGNTNRFGYNPKFRLTGITNGAGDWVSLFYNATDGNLSTRTDAGGTTSYGYDSYGLLSGVTYPASLGSEIYLNHPRGDVTNFTNGRGFVTTLQYNQRRQLTNTIAPTNLVTSLTFDAVGNLQTIKDARGFITAHTWSPTRKLIGVTFPATPQGTPVATNVYDNRDWLARTLDPLQRATLFTNDAAGRLISATDPLLRTSSLKFDADGRKTATTNAALETTSRQWNARGELTKLTDAANHTALHAYDGNGNEILLTNRNGKIWQFQFDAANRLTNTISPLNRQTKQVWNNRGLLQTVIEPSMQTTTLGYDAKARLTNRADSVGTTLFQYDANNNPTNVAESGKTNSWVLDAYDRVTSYRDADGNLIQYRYDSNGNVTNLIYPGNRTVTYFYDSLNRLTNVTDWAGRKTTIAFDLASQIKSITRPNQTVRLLNYDAGGQLTNIVEQLTNGTPISFFKLKFNAAARVEWEFAAPLPHATNLPTRTMTYDDDNRIAKFNNVDVGYDLDGNLTNGPLLSTTFVNYAYDARNRLLNVGGLSYTYDPAGNRTAVTNGAVVSKFVVNPNAALPQVLIRVKPGVTNYYIYGPGLLYEITETATTTNALTYHFDYRGSTVALTDGNGNVTDRIEYSAYATTTYRVGTNDTPFLFNGRYGVQTDANGLLYMRARYYNPYICRFLNPDPSGFAGGLNWYAFADGNPISLIDPFGLGAVEGWGGATATWINRHLVNPLNSVSTTSTTVNFASYMAASIVGGLGDMLRLGQGTANAVYNAEDGWDVAIGITEDIQRAAGLTTLIAGGVEGVVKRTGPTTTVTGPTRNVVNFEGMEVRAVRDLSHIDDSTLYAMQENGFAPTTVNGERVVLHHLDQNPAGPVVEMPRGNNNIWNTTQHPQGNTPGAGLSAEQRASFDTWRQDYWKWRATQELTTRRVLGQ